MIGHVDAAPVTFGVGLGEFVTRIVLLRFCVCGLQMPQFWTKGSSCGRHHHVNVFILGGGYSNQSIGCHLPGKVPLLFPSMVPVTVGVDIMGFAAKVIPNICPSTSMSACPHALTFVASALRLLLVVASFGVVPLIRWVWR